MIINQLKIKINKKPPNQFKVIIQKIILNYKKIIMIMDTLIQFKVINREIVVNLIIL
jgi:hypothetical protein